MISVDTKKKELIGAYKNGGREYQRKGEPTPTNTYDFIGEGGKAQCHLAYFDHAARGLMVRILMVAGIAPAIPASAAGA